MSMQCDNGDPPRSSSRPGDDNNYRIALADLRADVEAIEADVAAAKLAYAAVTRRRDELLRAEAVLADLAGEAPMEVGRPSRSRMSADDPRSITQAIGRAMLAAGRPLRARDVVRALVTAGHPLPANPESRYSSVYSALRRRFVSAGDHRWTTFAENEDESSEG